ncbi:GNAT family N-acetyltransferase [Candidatus Bathyarchaeota archaeon]|nr:GNAT family N-acetyltransferase [Candidatus Bathyarchaeota archaeon]
MFHVENMTPEDFEFAVRLSNTMNWEATEEDFEFMMSLEPNGCFVLYHDSERIGIATTISFEQVGWLGNVIVSERHRGKGGGSLIVRKAIDYLTNKGVKTIGLYSYIDRIPFYTRLGFKFDSKFIVMRGNTFYEPAECPIKTASKDDLPAIECLDRKCFGGSRVRLLERILFDQPNICYVYKNASNLVGYAVTKVTDEKSEIGPLVCQREHANAALSLLSKLLGNLKGLEIFMCLPEKETVIRNFLMQHKFREQMVLARMFYGPPIVNDFVYVAESLERG